MKKIEQKHFKNNFEFNGQVDVWESDYITYSKKTKVIFAHDAQSLFDQRETWNNQSWKVEETINKHKIDCIVISAQTPGDRARVNLLSPFPNSDIVKKTMPRSEYVNSGGSGGLYLNFIVNKVIPTILKEKNIPLESDKYIIGSSMGGYINTYAIAAYGEYFKGYGIFSPAYWYNNYMIFEKAIKYTKNVNTKIYIDIGTKEGNETSREYYLNDARKAFKILESNNPDADLRFIVEEGGVHNEIAWAKRFDNMINWFLGIKE